MNERNFKKYLAFLRAAISLQRVCVHCGCSDLQACPRGCSWVIQHEHAPTGVCSSPACVRKEKKQAAKL
jgi:hypothetical protein